MMNKKMKNTEVEENINAFDKKIDCLILDIQKNIFKGLSEQRKKEIKKVSSESTKIYKECMTASS